MAADRKRDSRLRGNIRIGGLFLLLAVFVAFPALAITLQAIPPVGRVVDTAHVLQPAQKASLEQKLAALETEKGSQLVVLIVPTTQPEAIEQYSIRVAEAWKIGRKGTDDGVILLVAVQDRAMRIEVGYGLEGALPDVTAKRIISEIITPAFRNGDMPGGIDQGVDAISAVIRGEALPAPKHTSNKGDTGDDGLQFLVMISVFVTGSLMKLYRKPITAIGCGLTAGLVGTFILGSLFTGIVAGILTLLAGIALLSVTSTGYRSGYGWHSGGGSGGSSGGSSFSGGGGSFGGGGASGRW